MANIFNKVQQYLINNSKTWEAEENNISLQNNSDGAGVFIATWNVSGLAKPTIEQLDNLNDEADASEAARLVLINRRKEYGTPENQIENIIENGLEAEQARVQTIKEKYPKE